MVKKLRIRGLASDKPRVSKKEEKYASLIQRVEKGIYQASIADRASYGGESITDQNAVNALIALTPKYKKKPFTGRLSPGEKLIYQRVSENLDEFLKENSEYSSFEIIECLKTIIKSIEKHDVVGRASSRAYLDNLKALLEA